MDRIELIKKISMSLEGITTRIDYRDDKRRAVLETSPENVVKVADHLFNEVGMRLITASALDSTDKFEIYYHFSYDENGLILSVHTEIPANDPTVYSITNICPAANWIEREMHELYGIDFKDHPNMEPLISEGNWESGVFPFRKREKDTLNTPLS